MNEVNLYDLPGSLDKRVAYYMARIGNGLFRSPRSHGGPSGAAGLQFPKISVAAAIFQWGLAGAGFTEACDGD